MWGQVAVERIGPNGMPQEIAITSLPLEEPLKVTVFSSNGDLLLEEGVAFNAARLEAFLEAGIETVCTPVEGESVDDCRYQLRYQKVGIHEIPVGAILALSIFDNRSQLLIQEGAQLAPAHSNVLARQGIESIFIRKELSKDADGLIKSLRKALNRIAVDEATTAFGEAFKNEKLDETRVFDGNMNGALQAESQRAIKHDDNVRKLVETDRLSDTEDDSNRQVLHSTRQDLFERLKHIFEDISKGKFTDGKEIGKFVHEVVNGLVSNRFHRLHIAEPDEDKHYLPSHSLNTTIFSINMAARLGFAMSEILELGYGAVLHDVGMMRVKPEIVNKAQPLTPNEMAEIRMHPSFGLDLIHPIKSLPVTTPIICYQENERLDGSGYPMAKGTAILLTFTRIVTIAASYDAMTRTRPYRAALAPYDAITELLKAVHAGKLDSDCTRALLETLSLFPICSGVELSDGRVGYVLDTQGNNYTRPVIAIEYKNDGQPLDQELILDLQRTENQAIRIVRAIPKYTRRVTGRTMKLPTTKA